MRGKKEEDVKTLPKEFIIMGKKELKKSLFNPIQNRHFIKPDGGLWASPYTPNEEFVSAWHEWCYRCVPSWIQNDNLIIKLKTKASIYTIDSTTDLNNLVQIIGLQEFPIPITSLTMLDFERASQIYDGIYLTDKGEWETRRITNKYNLYGWDCASLLIMNFDIIESWRYLDIKLYSQSK